jgi:acetoin utilization deacetylase AcuC-like enzyme
MLIICGPVGDQTHVRRGHPEAPARIGAVMAGLADLHLGSDLRVVPSRTAELRELRIVHSEAHLRQLARRCLRGGGDIDPDTYLTPDSWRTACQAAGAGLAAVEELARCGDGVALVAVRPPGHHASWDRSSGFCLVNNIAVAAAPLIAGGERVLIVDWDVHHGNGTQAIFWDDPNVLYVSVHQWPAYPGTGRASEVGSDGARGGIVNIPLPPGATGDVVRAAMDRIAGPVVERFEPSWVLVSAGFDGHRADPLADWALSGGDFADLSRIVAGWAPRPGRVALFLEGGYQLAAVRTSVASAVSALIGVPYRSESATAGGPGMSWLSQLVAERAAAMEHCDRRA